MATIPVYGQQRAISGVQSAPTASSNVRGDDPVFSGVQNIGNALGNLGGVLATEARKKEEDRAAVEVANALSQGEVYWQQSIKERTNAWKVGDDDLRGGFGTDFDKWVSKNTEKLPTDAAKKYFQQHTATMKGRYQQGLFTFQDKTTTDKLNADTEVGIQDDENIVFNDSGRRGDVLARRAETILSRNDLNEAQKLKLVDTYRRKLDLAAERGEMERDPAGWYVSRYGGMPEVAGGKVKPGYVATGGSAIANAIYGQESSGGKADTTKVNSQNVTGPMQMMESTFNGMKSKGLIPKDYDWKNPEQNKDAGFKWVEFLSQKYNGDPEKVAAAYYGGEGAVSADGTIKRHWKNNARPQDPTVGQYVDQVIGRMKRQGGVVAEPQQVAGDVPAPKNLPRSYSGLDWEQQSAMKRQAETLIKQDQTKIFANAAIETAGASVAAQNIGTTQGVDLSLATAGAVSQLEQRLGRKLDATETQTLETQVSRAAGVRERDRKIAQDNAAGSMFDLLDKNGGDYQDLQRQMAGRMDGLPRSTLDRLQAYSGEVATGGTRVTDWQAYSQLVDNPDLLASTNLTALKDKFSRDEFAQLTKLQQSVAKAKEEGRTQTIQSDMAVVKDLLAEAGIKKDEKKEAKFFSMLQREMDAQMDLTGKKKLNQDEVKKLASSLLTKEITKKGWLWDTKEMAFNITVPQADQVKISAALQSAGIPVNDSTILKVYRNKLQRSTQPAPATAKPAPVAAGYGQDTGIQPIQ